MPRLDARPLTSTEICTFLANVNGAHESGSVLSMLAISATISDLRTWCRGTDIDSAISSSTTFATSHSIRGASH